MLASVFICPCHGMSKLLALGSAQLILCTDEHCSDTRPWQGLEVDGSDTCVDGLMFSRQSYVLHMLSKSYQ